MEDFCHQKSDINNREQDNKSDEYINIKGGISAWTI
jgi:hypothetical protein